jgi:uncharacterized membrane protein YesL
MTSQPPSHKSPSRGWATEDERPIPPPPFLRQIFTDLWESSFTLIIWALVLVVLFLVVEFAGLLSPLLGWILAAFTMAPGLVGMMVPTGKLARGGFSRLGDAVRGTFHLYWRSVALALPVMLILMIVNITADIVRAVPERREISIAWVLQISIGLTVLILHVYLFPVLALYDTSLKQTVALAMVLVGRFIWQTLALIVLAAGLLAATSLHPLVWLFVPGVWCVIVMNATWRMARRIAPNLSGIDK